LNYDFLVHFKNRTQFYVDKNTPISGELSALIKCLYSTYFIKHGTKVETTALLSLSTKTALEYTRLYVQKTELRSLNHGANACSCYSKKWQELCCQTLGQKTSTGCQKGSTHVPVS
jgi:hypothetical protein